MGYSRQNEKINRKWDLQKAKMDGLGKTYFGGFHLLCLQVERYPPLETRNLLHTDKVVKTQYLPLIIALLKKYPHLRFEGCFNPENEWQKGYNNYTPDHPVMQFVSYQLSLMNKGMDKEEAFSRTEKVFYKNRMESEKKQKVSMALDLDEEASPLYTTGSAYLAEKEAQDKVEFLTGIRDELRLFSHQFIRV
ncbi:uncharacterized protein TA18525 [Theileria annulata]|uniref:Uncharacterized protein n=1 Tax=Theileria annulata TaxID=5874 RepID=Q4UBI3_THEAN|nr:uncharacterized protein TA18525 [Theileria annulata]CAI75818.1 hypothetical protein, conserved [Theileria annulata]|eukprot:XP_955294.1 hypothetical protein, conserved [Theileria annulata]